MADTDDDEDFGSDDALFDDLPPNTLLQLEQEATSQYCQKQQDSRPTTSHGNSKSNAHSHAAVQNAWTGQNQESFQSARTVQPDAEDDYGYNDEDVVDLDEDPYALPRQYDQEATFANRLETGPSDVPQTRGGAVPGLPTANASIAELQARILALENDRSSLQRQVEDARSAAQSKAGEAAILRGKAEKAAKEYEQKVGALRLQHSEERAKQLAEIDKIKKDNEKFKTNNKFLEHDLAFEAGKVRQLQRTQKLQTTAERRTSDQQQHKSPAVTPRKTRVLPYRDGFDDGDLVMLSPSKPRTGSKPPTPSKAGAKRKRISAPDTQVAATTAPNFVQPDSPAPHLVLSEPKIPSVSRHTSDDSQVSSEILHKLAREQGKLRFMQKMLRHEVSEDSNENIFEALTRYAFPAQPDRKLSSTLYEHLSLQSSSADAAGDKSLPEQFADAILSLWEQALQESYYEPIMSLVSCIQRIFDLERFVFVRKYTVRASSLAVATADLVAVPTARALIAKASAPKAAPLRSFNSAPKTSFIAIPPSTAEAAIAAQENAEAVKNETAKKHIQVLSCLELLETIALAAKPDKESITLFWQTMSFDFVLLFLVNGQPINQMLLMLSILQTSCLPTSFGSISTSTNEARQEKQENELLDRLTSLIGEKFDLDREDVTSVTVFEIREKIVLLLHKLVFTKHGAARMAYHRHTIPRLFKHMHTSLTNLHLYPSPQYFHAPISSSINAAMTIIYLLCSSSGSTQMGLEGVVDLRQKLGGLQGGMHLHLLVLTRMAFAERIWAERGLGEREGEMAHEMLDEWLSPEEGDMLMGVLGGSSSVGGSDPVEGG